MEGGECVRETVCEGWLDGTFILTVLSREESMSKSSSHLGCKINDFLPDCIICRVIQYHQLS